MANKKQGWLQKAKRQMDKKGTVGAFTEYCGGKVTNQCIERAMNSNNETLRKRAQFAKNMREMQFGDFTAPQDSIVKASQLGRDPMTTPPVPAQTLPDTTMRGQPVDPNIMQKRTAVDESKIKKFEKGGDKSRRLPGGVMKPIGYGAFKFHGNKHDEEGLGSDSGIILERGGKKKRGLEVEDGELQVDVDTNEGEKEYIVSNYIKNPATGNTLAEDLEKELKRAKNNQEAAKITARYVRLNEQLKESTEDEDDDMEKAQKGTINYGPSGDSIPVDPDDPDQKLNPAGAQASGWIDEQHRTEEGLFKRTEQEDPNVQALIANNPWYKGWDDFDPAKPADVKKFQEAYNEKAPEGKKIKIDGKLGEQTASAYIPYQAEKQEVAERPEDPSEWDIGNFEEPVDESEPAPEAPAAPEPEGKPAKFRPRMTGTMLQALGPAYAMTQDLSTRKMKPEYAREIRMGRVNLDPERAAAAQQSQGAASGITSSVAGPAALAMQQKNLSAGQASQRGITDQESRSNIQIAGQEKGINAGIRQRNAANAMQASQVNAAAMNQTAQLNQAKNIAAMNQLGKIGTQTVKDYNKQYANFGSDLMEYGAPAADYYANVYKGNTPFGIGSRDISIAQMDPAEVTAIYNRQNKAQSEVTPQENTTEPAKEPAKRGRYIKKSNKVRRKKRRK